LLASLFWSASKRRNRPRKLSRSDWTLLSVSLLAFVHDRRIFLQPSELVSENG